VPHRRVCRRADLPRLAYQFSGIATRLGPVVPGNHVAAGGALRRIDHAGETEGARRGLAAEHGLAALVTVTSGNTSDSLLFDAGLSKNRLMHNMDVLRVRPKELHTIVLSHGGRGPIGVEKRNGAFFRLLGVG
jgi:hypothetical protein